MLTINTTQFSNSPLVVRSGDKGHHPQNHPLTDTTSQEVSTIFEIVDKEAQKEPNLALKILIALNGHTELRRELELDILELAKEHGVSIEPSSPQMDNIYNRLTNQAHAYQDFIEEAKSSFAHRMKRKIQLALGTGLGGLALAGGGLWLSSPSTITDPQPSKIAEAETFDFSYDGLASPRTIIDDDPERMNLMKLSSGGEPPDPLSADAKPIILKGPKDTSNKKSELKEKFLSSSPLSETSSEYLMTVSLPIGDRKFRDNAESFTQALALKFADYDSFRDLDNEERLRIAETAFDCFKGVREYQYKDLGIRPLGPVTPIVIDKPGSNRKETITVRVYDNQLPEKMLNREIKLLKPKYPSLLEKAFQIHKENKEGTDETAPANQITQNN